MTEKEYRALEIDSYSSLKVFIEDRKKYYKKFVLREPVREEESDEMRFGSLVDCLLFTPEEFDNRYAMSVSKVPSGQWGKLMDELWAVTLANLNANGEVTKEVEDMLEEAYNNVKYDRRTGEAVAFKRESLEKVKEKFPGSEAEMYYRQLRESHGKTILDLSELETAQAVVQELRTNEFTKDIINLVNDKRYEVYNQFPIIGEVDGSITGTVGYKLKCLIDKLVIDHERKIIYIYDLKTAWDNERSFIYNYRKYKYYIQLAVYFYLVVEWKKKQPKLKDYAVMYPRFIVAESSNYKAPLVYYTDISNFNQGMRGFIYQDEYHPGVIRAIRDLAWHRETGIWRVSRENYEGKGYIKLEPFNKDK